MDSDMNNGNDTTDMFPFKNCSKKTSKKVTLCGNIDADEYSMKYPRKGKCLIFNHKKFDNLPERKGSDKDVSRLYTTLRKLGFQREDIKFFTDLKVGEVMAELSEAASSLEKKNNSEVACFICCVLTHGNNGTLWAKDGIYPLDFLYENFNGAYGPSLVCKPKVFFIQACQGNQTDSGVKVVYKESMDSVSKFKYPTNADFLIALSTFPGFVAYNDPLNGSYFIQYLCDALEEHAPNKHLIDMLTIVNRRFASYFESSSSKDVTKDRKKQMPLFMSTLTKNVKF